MMDIQTTPIDPQTEYVIDSALEHDELDAGSHVALKLYAPRAELMRIIDDEDYVFDGADSMRTRVNRCEALATLADDILYQLPIQDRAPIAVAGWKAAHARIRSLAWHYAICAHQDVITGGCMIAWKRPTGGPESRRMHDYRLTPKQSRKLASPSWIKRYVRSEQETADLVRVGRRVRARLAGVDMASCADSAEKITQMLLAQHEQYRRYNARQIARMSTASQLSRMITTLGTRKFVRERRAVIKRAAVLAASVLGAANLSAFAAGRPVELSGETISLEVARLGSCGSMGHGQIAVVAIDPTSKRRLADLCVYHENTPALDQVTALALAMQAGDEAEIIETANLSRITDLGLQHPLIAKKDKQKMTDAYRPRDDRREANEAYWRRSQHLWTEAVGVAALGRLWSKNEGVAT